MKIGKVEIDSFNIALLTIHMIESSNYHFLLWIGKASKSVITFTMG